MAGNTTMRLAYLACEIGNSLSAEAADQLITTTKPYDGSVVNNAISLATIKAVAGVVAVDPTISSIPSCTVAPAVTGTATVGSTLTSTAGTWTGVATIVNTYQWQRAGVDIAGATA